MVEPLQGRGIVVVVVVAIIVVFGGHAITAVYYLLLIWILFQARLHADTQTCLIP